MCVNTVGSFYCACQVGYNLNSNFRTCDDINECTVGHPCPGDCINTIGSFQCRCGGDQTYDPITNRCVSPDYCAGNPCQYRCVSGSTTYHCYCMSGYELGADGRSCNDINECQSSNGGCSHQCINQPGSYQCSCNSGYTLDGNGRSCNRVQCPNPPSIDGFVFTCTAPHYVGDTCHVTCDQTDATLAGSDTIRCQSTGYWEAATAACSIPIPNEAPSNLALSTSSVLENVPINTAVGTFIVTDRNIDQTHTFALTNSAGNRFRINNNNLLVNGQLNYEASTSHTITVRVTDNGSPQMSAQFSLTINILNENEPPSSVTITSNAVAENAAINTVVGSFQATDPDAGQRVSYDLLTTGGGKFEMNSNAQLYVAASLNYEAQSQYMLSVRVSDSASPSLSTISTITIMVQDRNDAPTSISPLFLIFQENPANGQTLTTFGVVDDDQNSNYVVTLTPSYGLVVNSLRLTVSNNSLLDYEAYSTHRVTASVTLTDGPFSLTRQLTLQLADDNEPPTGITLSSSSVHEHSTINTVIGSLAATDPDLNDTHVFTLLSGLQSNLVRIDRSSLLVNADIDHETYSSFSIMVMVADKGQLTFPQTLTISVVNENEAPRNFMFTANSMYMCSPSQPNQACVQENTRPPQSIGQFTATDPDGDTITYTLRDFIGLSSYFSIDQSSNPPQLMLSGNTLDYETSVYGSQLVISVQIADAFDHSSVHSIIVQILNVNDAPTNITLSNTIISEESGVDQIIGSLDAMDEDEGDVLTFRLDYNPSGLFNISDNHLVVARALDHEVAMNVHNISIVCSDGMAETSPAWFIIEISDAAEPPINITLDSNTIPENSPSFTTVGTVMAFDMDMDESLAYNLDDDARGKFMLTQDGDNYLLQSTEIFNYEEENSYSIVVRVTDSTGHFKLQIFIIKVSWLL